MGTKGSGREIVQVQGGHIVRSSGRKDRHSKVYTAKGPRDRRVRLSAHTAIQFYDVQDRLGYDRPSKAVDWLIKKAKTAIDKLAEIPPWHPTPLSDDHEIGSDEITLPEQEDSSRYSFQVTNNNTAFLPPSMEPFFPTSSSSSSMNFQGYPIEDLGLSLHSFQSQSQGNATTVPSIEQTLYPPSVHGGFDGSFPRIANWSGEESRVSVGFGLNPMQIEHQQQQDAISLRGTLQSGFLQSFRPWNELPMTSTDHSKLHVLPQSFVLNGRDELQGFAIPSASLHGHGHGHEERTTVSDTPTSSSPNSHQ